MAKRKRRKADATGRSAGAERFWMLTYSMATSAAFRSLGGAALKVLVELRCKFDGTNNGELFLSYKDAAEKLGLGRASIHRAFAELQDKGFVRQTRAGHWYSHRAATWAVTDRPIQAGEPAPNDWRRWQPRKQNSVPIRNQEAPHGSATEPRNADRSVLEPRNGPFEALDGSVSELHLHFTKGGAGDRGEGGEAEPGEGQARSKIGARV